jgi:hypothetical protein
MKTTACTLTINLWESQHDEHRSADKCVSEQQQMYSMNLGARQVTVVLRIS